MFVSQKICDVYYATSFFMLIPAFHCLGTNFWFGLLLVINCAASLQLWSYFVHESIYHKLDRWCSCCTIYCVCFQRPSFTYFLPVVVLPYILGRQAYLNGKETQSVVCHLLFRYFAFWLCLAHASDFLNVYIFVIYTTCYLICIVDCLNVVIE